MRLNFWQWLGVILFVIALGLIFWQRSSFSTPPITNMPNFSDSGEEPTTSTTTPSTAPTTAP